MDKIEELLTRGVEKIYPSKSDLEKLLRSGKKLKLYQGFDPTGTQLHIGHMVGFRKLRAWQDLGHEVIFLIGDGTGQAGDPSGKLVTRNKFHTREELRENATDYVMQASKIVRFTGENAVKILYNGDWLNRLTLVEILDIISHFSLQQLSERDLFQERMKRGETVNLREFIYPLLQGYDSVAMEVDLELGGSDQLFNMLVGRQLVKDYLKKEKFVMTTPLLADSEGRKIGKTEGNVIALTDKPEELFGKIMTLGDDVIIKALEFLTDVPMDEIQNMQKLLDNGENPMLLKKRLAFEIVKQLNSDDSAKLAQEYFESTVQQRELPTELPSHTYSSQSHPDIIEILINVGFAESKNEAKRLIEQGGVEIDGTKITDSNSPIIIRDGIILKVGKRRIVKLMVNN